MRLKFYKRSAEKFVSRIDPEAFSASGSRVIFSVARHLRFKASATKRDELEEIPMKIPRCLRRGIFINSSKNLTAMPAIVSFVGATGLLHDPERGR